MTTERLSWMMNTLKLDRRDDLHAPHESPTARADRLAVWVLLALGLLLMLVSTAKGEQATATRTDRFSGTLAAGQTLSVANISGDIVASPGRAFSAVVTVTVSAPTQKQAEELLRNARIEQSQDEEGWSLETRWPGTHGRRGRDSSCSRCRVLARYELIVPAGVAVDLQTVNGDVRVNDLDGELDLESVNGTIEARGVRQSLEAQTVNGPIAAVALALGRDSSISLESVNGSITLTLPKTAQFDLSAETMNGTISSTFPLAPVPGPPPPKASKGAPRPDEKARRIVVTDEEGGTTEVDLDELDAELAESMREFEIELREAEREIRQTERRMRKIRVVDPRREYRGSIGQGGASVQLETLNGAVLLLAAGTKESDAKPLVSERREFVVTVPEVHVDVPRVQVKEPKVNVKVPPPPAPPAPPVPGAPPAPPADFEGEVVRGDVSGDFLSTTSGGSYRIGRVSGEVRIVTHSGEIRVAGIGAGGELKTYGGDIIVGPVVGELRASTAAGDIRVDSVSGSAVAETAGGDIRIQSVGGNLDANTAGGDIIAPRVGGSVKAITAGGDVRIAVTSKDIRGGITIRSEGGDVTLSLPPDCKADVELVVLGVHDSDTAIRSDFGELTLARRSDSQRATAVLNGGGEKIVVRTTSGSIRLRKNPTGN
jgi:DUF4097 and DUF4098 domain-containing protein YvlB